MAIISKKIEKVEEAPIIKVLELFLTNMHLLEPRERKILIHIISEITLPKHIIEERIPIEEEYLKSKY